MGLKDDIDAILNGIKDNGGGNPEPKDTPNPDDDKDVKDVKDNKDEPEPKDDGTNVDDGGDGGDGGEGGDATDDGSQQQVDPAVDLMRSAINDIFSAFTQQQQASQQNTGKVDVPDTGDISDEEIEQAMQSPEALKALLKKREQALLNTVSDSVLNKVMTTVVQQVQMQSAVSSFYATNPDLKPYKDFVGYVAKVVAEEHPDMTMEQVLDTAAQVTRQKLMLNKGKVSGQRQKPTAPRRLRKKMSSLEEEIMDLIS